MVEEILGPVEAYYSAKIREHGPTARGVDWNSPESQALRFEELLRVCGGAAPLSINDYGCGYGALYDYLAGRGQEFTYCGFDISPAMIAAARQAHDDCATGSPQGNCAFVTEERLLPRAGYTVASGIFNVRLQAGEQEWLEYVLDTLGRMAGLSERGFAFNVLTKYSDPERMRPDLYYADPLFLFDYCKRHLSRYVALLHDYPLYEFTILVRKEDG